MLGSMLIGGYFYVTNDFTSFPVIRILVSDK